MNPLCFILMPFGTKPSPLGGEIHFDLIYQQIIAPAVSAAGMEPIRADLEQSGGVIHKAMFERLLLCDYAVADLTTANANVFYELGIRHTHRPASTALIFSAGQTLPFDVNNLRGLPYQLDSAGKPASAAADYQALTARLQGFLDRQDKPDVDSPLFQLLDNFPQIDRLKTDTFRDQARYSQQLKTQLADARAVALDDNAAGLAAVQAVADKLLNLREQEPGVLIDLLLSWRALSAWQQMVALVEAIPLELQQTALVQEQYGLALNRAGDHRKAERVLTALIKQRGPSSETCGILGRVYKDRWQQARDNNEPTARINGLLNQAINCYLQGFEADWRDAYPGINALALMEQATPPDPRRIELNPVVSYAVKRRISGGGADYWDYATLLELAVLAGDAAKAEQALSDATAVLRESWEADTTANNLQLICNCRQQRGEDTGWLEALIETLKYEASR
ncbi:MAG: DUF4071 domain-containing protein [Marinobacterium sp.]|nr:DUF4071 domain-containing protein [Marinobacterium sp.]